MQNRVHYLSFSLVLLVLCIWCTSGRAQESATPPVAASLQAISEPAYFDQQIRPLLAQYCLSCHSTEKPKGELDLQRFTSLDEVRRHPGVWQSVSSQLADGEMPPKEKPQPSAAERQRLSNWITSTLDQIARSRAGDPGPVVLRRLSNAEYTYTLRDLTGIESLQPAKEFPVDSAAGEGFTNTGQSLVMSPSLVTKYFDAAKEVAGHAVLLPDGIRFSPGATRRDWTGELLSEIRSIYHGYTDPRSGQEQMKLQEVVVNTNGGGRPPLEKYFAAMLKERPALVDRTKDVETFAREQGLSRRYVQRLLDVLSADTESPLLAPVRNLWKKGQPADAVAMAAQIEPWQKSLWKFNRVGHIGKVDGPTRWMEPAVPLAAKQEMRVKLPKADAAKELTVYLLITDAGDGNAHDLALWHRPRFEAKGKPTLLLRDLGNADNQPVVDPRLFGRHPNGSKIDEGSLCVQAPSMLEIRLPAERLAGYDFVATVSLEAATGAEGSIQAQVLTAKPPLTAEGQPAARGATVIANDGTATRERFQKAFDEFRDCFPAALCYTQIVPVDEVVTLTLYHREDDQLARLMLDDAQKARLDRLWDELRYVSQDALTRVDAYAQLMEYATQDSDPSKFAPLGKPINEQAAAFRQRLIDTQPKHLQAVIGFAEKAYRRPLQEPERQELRKLYEKLRQQELPHEEAIRLTIARVLVSPAFLYRPESPVAGNQQGPVSDWELASRLSYFLSSSMPDETLRRAAAEGKLSDPEQLIAQSRRMLKEESLARRLAIEFACQWLHVHGFDQLDEKSERHFPGFVALRGAMYEESIRFFTDFFQQNRSVLNVLDADYTYLNGPLAKHYDIPNVDGDEWRRVEGVKQYSRGGVLGQASMLAKHSGASRTSPILRGIWLTETLLGEKLPKPPPDVPLLPEDEAAETLTVRQLTEKHTADPRCAGCHARIDPFGYALERFDGIGRFRQRDSANRELDTRAKVLDGTTIDGLEGLRSYLLNQRREAFVRQFCRKLLGYAMGRGVMLSDEPLLEEMQAQLRSNEYRVGAAIESILRSRQFREIRGRDQAVQD